MIINFNIKNLSNHNFFLNLLFYCIRKCFSKGSSLKKCSLKLNFAQERVDLLKRFARQVSSKYLEFSVIIDFNRILLVGTRVTSRVEEIEAHLSSGRACPYYFVQPLTDYIRKCNCYNTILDI